MPITSTLRAALLTVLVAAGALAGTANAVERVADDGQGRSITFDVQAAGADVEGYAAVLRGLRHGDEISDVVVRIIPENRIATECGSGALACYRWSSAGGARITVPSLPPERVTASLTHEYGHHVDATYAHLPGARGLDGTRRWWGARGMAALLSSGEVAFDYQRGWSRSIAEIFAEDYKYLHHPSTGHKIAWLGRPGEPVLDALRADLGTAAPTPNPGSSGSGTTRPPAGATPPAPPAVRPRGKRAKSRFSERGRLGPRRRRAIPFPVLSVRRVRVAVRVTNGRRRVARAVLRCNARTVARRRVRGGRPVVLQARRVTPNPGRCTLRVTAGRRAVKYAVTVRKIRTP